MSDETNGTATETPPEAKPPVNVPAMAAEARQAVAQRRAQMKAEAEQRRLQEANDKIQEVLDEYSVMLVPYYADFLANAKLPEPMKLVMVKRG